MSRDIIAAIDKAVASHQPSTPRAHLGASGIGDRCARKGWYTFRWARLVRHTGRLLRLFDRGHSEEERFVRFLRQAGAEVREYSTRLLYHGGIDSYINQDWSEEFPGWELDDVSEDPLHIRRATDRGDGPAQWGFSDHSGHFGGSADGKIIWEEKLPPGWGLVEFKTHSYKSFADLQRSGVRSSKPTHYVQMQLYMHYLGLGWGLYLAVNKNDDQLYAEVIYYQEEVAKAHAEKAGKIIHNQEAPSRITQDPSWYECRFCDYRDICHYNAVPHKNCRSCVYASPIEDGEWRCNKFGGTIPEKFIPSGCDDWVPIK